MVEKDWTVSSIAYKHPATMKTLRQYQINPSC